MVTNDKHLRTYIFQNYLGRVKENELMALCFTHTPCDRINSGWFVGILEHYEPGEFHQGSPYGLIRYSQYLQNQSNDWRYLNSPVIRGHIPSGALRHIGSPGQSTDLIANPPPCSLNAGLLGNRPDMKWVSDNPAANVLSCGTHFPIVIL